MKKSRPKKKKVVSKKKSIPAHQARVGKIYLTKMCIPIKIKKITSKGVEVMLTLVNKPLMLKRNTPLFEYEKSRVKKTTVLRRLRSKNSTRLANLKGLIQKPSAIELPAEQRQVRRGPKGPRSQSVSSIVDPMLTAGAYTRQQICVELGKSDIGKVLSNRDMNWYVGDRIAVLKKRSYNFEQHEDGTVKLFKPTWNLIREKIGV